MTTNEFLRYGDIAYQSEWIKMPNKLQKFIPLIIADAQRPLIFEGLNIIVLNLMTFTKVNTCRTSQISDINGWTI